MAKSPRVEAALDAFRGVSNPGTDYERMVDALAAADEAEPSLLKKHAEWVWKRCPGCGRYSKYQEPPDWEQTKKQHPDWTWTGDFHSDGCPLEGLYSHTHQWWFERELERAEAAARDFAKALAEIRERHPTISKHDTGGLIAQSALAAHPEYSEESGT